MMWKNILKQEWEIRPCWSGTDCWCRRICTKSGTIVIGGALLYKDVASYFVALHNAKLRNERGYCSRIDNIYSKKFENIKFYDDNDKLIKKDLIHLKWKVIKCGVRKCWCRIIKAKSGHVIICAGALNKREAKYIVRLHNTFLLRRIKTWP